MIIRRVELFASKGVSKIPLSVRKSERRAPTSLRGPRTERASCYYRTDDVSLAPQDGQGMRFSLCPYGAILEYQTRLATNFIEKVMLLRIGKIESRALNTAYAARPEQAGMREAWYLFPAGGKTTCFFSQGNGFFYFGTHLARSVSSLCYYGVFRIQSLVLE